MPYLICDTCEIYYEVDSDFDITDLNTCEKCGKGLKYYNDLNECYKEKNSNTERENADFDNFYIGNYTYDKITTTGLILAITGLFILILAYVSPFFFLSQSFVNPYNMINSFVYIVIIYCISFLFMVTGAFIYIYSKRKENRLEVGVKKENGQKNIKRNVQKRTAGYFNKLPEGYFILNNLKIPGRKIEIDHVVIGPTGIFLTMIKNLHGHYIINDNEWLNNKGKLAAGTMVNPSRQVKLNAIELKRYLESKNLNIDYILINSIVAFSKRNFTVRKMPVTYNIMHVDEIPQFIIDSKTKMGVGTITESVVFLERYSRGVMRS